jgi:hypothetical protein
MEETYAIFLSNDNKLNKDSRIWVSETPTWLFLIIIMCSLPFVELRDTVWSLSYIIPLALTEFFSFIFLSQFSEIYSFRTKITLFLDIKVQRSAETV